MVMWRFRKGSDGVNGRRDEKKNQIVCVCCARQ